MPILLLEKEELPTQPSLTNCPLPWYGWSSHLNEGDPPRQPAWIACRSSYEQADKSNPPRQGYACHFKIALFPFCSHSTGYHKFHLKYWLSHTKSFIVLDSLICETSHPQCSSEQDLLKMPTYKWAKSTPAYTLPFSIWPLPWGMIRLKISGRFLPGFLQNMQNWINHYEFLHRQYSSTI